MQLSDEFLEQWDHIISGVDKTEVPLECINKIVIRLQGGRQKTINLARLKRDGFDLEEIESVLTRNLVELGDLVRDIDFLVDVNAVARLVQPETDKLLKDL
jgi:hypothetical protein|tara:strand:- start:999 stop:1301 length:303 start_codon:yes stop_codon:yes gene_type:complete